MNPEEIKECIKFKLQYQVLPMLREYVEDRIISTDNIINNPNLKKYLNGVDDVIIEAVNELMPKNGDSNDEKGS